MIARSLAEVAPLGAHRRICVLTGAGISAATGLATYRGADGLWTLHPELEDAMLAERLPANLREVWQLAGPRVVAARAAGPTPAHRALATIDGLTVLTQNVDGLHRLAGSTDVIELHGSDARARCLSRTCGWTGSVDDLYLPADLERDLRSIGRTWLPDCPRCGSLARPASVLFGEDLDADVLAAAERAAGACDLFVAIGTSGQVAPACRLAPAARKAGALCVDVNIDPEPDEDAPFDVHVIGDAQVLVPEWASSTAHSSAC